MFIQFSSVCIAVILKTMINDRHNHESNLHAHNGSSGMPDSIFTPFPLIPEPWNTVRNSACPSEDEDPDSYELEDADVFEEGPIELADAVYSLNQTFKAESRQARFYNRFDPRYAEHIRSLIKTSVRIAQTIVTINKYQPERRADPECSPEHLNELYNEFSYHYRKTAAAAREACRCGNQSKLDEMFDQQTNLLHLLTRLFATRRFLMEKVESAPVSPDTNLSDQVKKSIAERAQAGSTHQPVEAAPMRERVRESALSSFKSIPGYPGLKPSEMLYFERNRDRIEKEILSQKNTSSLSAKTGHGETAQMQFLPLHETDKGQKMTASSAKSHTEKAVQNFPVSRPSAPSNPAHTPDSESSLKKELPEEIRIRDLKPRIHFSQIAKNIFTVPESGQKKDIPNTFFP